ncbi:LysM peptidoglycan-binding domain-containing protein [Kutzneria sp. 744]|uniref:CIS tube protein n=1 Tax=Kutzneria sp. (strain 744) TaxID=345341 RepID=UPI0004B6E33D|nr:LysM peptidoglycan-binding domain-containing protein [Kutzneria sp. 744]
MTGALGALGGAAGAVDMAAGVAIGAAALAGARVPAMLRCTDPANFGIVPFDFNPKKIEMSRQGSYGNRSTPTATNGSSNAMVTQNVRNSEITISEVKLEGLTTKMRCDTLLGWMAPGSALNLVGMVAALAGANLTTEPPVLTFQWGPPMIGFMYSVRMTNCKISYERFTSAGIPIRAMLNLTFREVPSLLGSLPMNPTSGGQPGRRTHTVGQGETLQSIATANYGTPALWRRIAEVNGIDDPTRLRPGSTIYLPNGDELTAGSPR